MRPAGLLLAIGAALVLLGLGTLLVANAAPGGCDDTGQAKCQAPASTRIGETWGVPVAAVGVLVLAAGGMAWWRGRRQPPSP
jgi:hypothetical protein